MSAATKNVLIGIGTIAVGLLLRLFTADVTTPVISLPKIGVVLMVIGSLDVLYGLYLAVRGSDATG